MVLIILSWIYIFFTTINLGYGLEKIISIKQRNLVITSFLGLFSATILGSIWAIFGRINIEFHVFLLVINFFIIAKYKFEIIQIYKSFIKKIKELEFGLQFFLVIISVLILAQCASIPYIIDNESYYIQTIKWINEYGFVKGLANLHIFLAQTSGWHVAQSIFNFSFLYKNFNDLSGFCLLLGNIFAIFKLNSYFKNQKKSFLIAGLLPFANVFFFQFISAPSPDIAVYILTFILLFYFIKGYKKTKIEDFNLITILTLFILFIKPTSILIALIPITLQLLNFKKLIKTMYIPTLVSILVLVVFITKNLLITGYPLFPLTNFNLSFDYAVPKNVMQYFFSENMRYSFFISETDLKNLSPIKIAIKWLFSSNINSIFNILTLIVFTLSPIFIYKYFNKKSVWIIYLVMLIQLMFLLIIAPQYRFFIHLTLFLSFLMFASWFTHRKYILLGYFVSTLLVIIVVFFPISFKGLTQNKLISKNSNFNIENTIFPHNNTKWKTNFQKHQKGNLIYNSPINNYFFWGTGNGDLPAVNIDQLNYFEKYFYVIPQQRTNNLKDGFYPKKLSENE
ncbi:LIC_10190 family membrane protein [Flavobacterium sp.]|uniref:LIC_10190 family membrane protein n=1 Tax=Flavobacterium sp. TaxID=239 RepID=UPI003753968B